MNFQKHALAAAMMASLGLGAAATAEAAVINATWSGLFTLLDPSGLALQNTSYPYYGDPTYGSGLRTQISGTFTFDTSTGAGTATVNPFEFCNNGPAITHDVVMQAVGDGMGGPGTLVVGSMLFDWGGYSNISVGIVLDAAGFFGALAEGAPTSTTVTGVGATPASNGISKGKYLIGPAPMATTTWNTAFDDGGALLTSNDTVGGDPMDNGPFPNFSANFDVTSIHITSVTAVPVPAAVWLLGSGLVGLVGVANSRQRGCAQCSDPVG